MRTVIVAFLASSLAVPQAALRGVFDGDWVGMSASGDFRISIADDSKAAVEVVFTIANTEVKTRVTSSKVTAADVEATYEFDLGGNRLQSAIKGHLDGSRLEGTYKTTATASGTQVDEGTWKAMKRE